MTPADYFRDMVEPTIDELEAEPTSTRRAYLACVVAYHFADAAAVHAKRKPYEVADELKGLEPDFKRVRDVANLAKHLELNPNHAGNKGRPLPRIEDTHLGPRRVSVVNARGEPVSVVNAAGENVFVGNAERVVCTKDGHGRPVALRDCLRKARAAIETYLARPDMR